MISSYFADKRGFMRRIVQSDLRRLGLLIGVLSAYAFPVISYMARMMANNLRENELAEMAVRFPLKSLFYFVGSIFLVSLIARVFGGRWKPLLYAYAAGWAGLLSIVCQLLLLPALAAGAASRAGATLSQPLLVIAVISILAMLLVLLEYIKLSVIIISEIFEMKIIKSFFVWIISAIPLFIVYSAIVKVT